MKSSEIPFINILKLGSVSLFTSGSRSQDWKWYLWRFSIQQQFSEEQTRPTTQVITVQLGKDFLGFRRSPDLLYLVLQFQYRFIGFNDCGKLFICPNKIDELPISPEIFSQFRLFPKTPVITQCSIMLLLGFNSRQEKRVKKDRREIGKHVVCVYVLVMRHERWWKYDSVVHRAIELR